jgi:hypothetical protein
MEARLLIPVYLNQRIVFDLLAMLEGGISHVTRVASAVEETNADERRYGAEFGLSKALASLLSISVSGDRKQARSTGEEVKKEEERIHTPASLFYRLRNRLIDEGQLHRIGDDYSPRVHDLVEFRAAMIRNPIVQTLDSFLSLMTMAAALSAQGSHSRSKRRQPKHDHEPIVKQMEAFRQTLEGGATVDMVAKGIDGKLRAVVTLEIEYLNDPGMADLVDGQFIVVGMVTRTVAAGEGAISLVRRSALNIMPRSNLEDLTPGFGSLSAEQGFNLPEIRWELPGPAFQVIPVAVYA